MSRWKPKKRKPLTRGNATSRACNRPPFEVIDAGEQLGLSFPEGPQGWMRQETWDQQHQPGQQAQLSQCRATGETWVKPIVGRYRNRTEEELEKRLAILTDLALSLGGAEPFFADGPTWFHVEFFENVLEFELRPPCGCPPHRALAAA